MRLERLARAGLVQQVGSGQELVGVTLGWLFAASPYQVKLLPLISRTWVWILHLRRLRDLGSFQSREDPEVADLVYEEMVVTP